MDWKREAEALNQRVRQLEASLSSVSTPRARPTDAAVLERVSQLVDESEARQQRVMAARLSELTRDSTRAGRWISPSSTRDSSASRTRAAQSSGSRA